MTAIEIGAPKGADEIAAARGLLVDYIAELGENLCFQGVDAELADYPGGYVALLVARMSGKVVGTVALKDRGEGRVEMKRLYVGPDARGTGAGRALAVAVLEAAKALGYREMVLDTLTRLKPALALYYDLGFKDCSAYYDNPLPGVVYLSRQLG
ncbi:GNAT family N-acetyltransferase [Pseudokordiimonas caeni]|uniref:GNAT family N-acetyltransferase n=1 Tax=Pseudokordiimonas caeni TaxID=2997908 RepID=UPI0028118468|nr:GNAT family N-acetyltransferase [Pseudokordiimonas caeni]